MKKFILLITITGSLCFSQFLTADGLEVNKKLPIWKSLLENNDIKLVNECVGKVLIINYIDPRYDDQTVPAILAVRNAIVDGRLSLKNFQAIGIIDCDTTWEPNSLIKVFAVKENKKLPRLRAILLFDYEGVLGTKYGLIIDKKNRNSILLIDKQGILRAKYRGEMTKKQITELVNTAVKLQDKPYKSAPNKTLETVKN